MTKTCDLANSYIGYFDDPLSGKPTYDPWPNCLCLACSKQVTHPMKTHSLMLWTGKKSYFFRTHNKCWDKLNEEEQYHLEGFYIDKFAKEEAVND